jgi:tetratricopeptide (TPR) repeat protein
VLRAGPFSDERIIRLANRRFVPFFFDLSTSGFAGDADARAFVVKVRPDYGGRGVPTPDVLFMTPQGKLLGQISNYASADQILKAMRRILKEHPEFNKPGADEAAAKTPLARARIAYDLLDFEAARRELARTEGPEAAYLLGRMAREEGDWKAADEHFAKVNDEKLLDDVRMERAYTFWKEKRFAELRDHLRAFPKESNRYTEARYYEGLAHFHLKKAETALAIWKSTIEASKQDPWVYRADWAYCNAKEKGGTRLFSSSAGKRTSCLNRIGYMGRRNPDLKG